MARRLGEFLKSKIQEFPHENAYGYLRGRNTRDNAGQHTGKKLLLHIDIQEFFPSISSQRVAQLLEKTGVVREIAVSLANFLTIDDKLPLGLPTSPIVSNAICVNLDIRLSTLADKYGATYTRYADDITFSSNGKLPDVFEVSEILSACGFDVAEEKTRCSKLGQNHYVTGLSVSDMDAPHAPRRMKRELRQELYYAEKYGLRDHLARHGFNDQDVIQRYINFLNGRVKYISYQEPHLSKKLVMKWQSILDASGDSPSFKPKDQKKRPFDFFIDETEFSIGQTKYLAIGFSASQHQDSINTAIEDLLSNYVADPLSDGKRDVIKDNGMHFADATEDLKRAFLISIQTLPFRGYIVFGKMEGSYSQTYLRLLSYVINRRLMAAESRCARFFIEQNSKISENVVRNLIMDAQRDLQERN
ncbi:MAG: reverse transcriptase family protein, partial [Bacteroidota bacterium]